jgi:hypothetical protein
MIEGDEVGQIVQGVWMIAGAPRRAGGIAACRRETDRQSGHGDEDGRAPRT